MCARENLDEFGRPLNSTRRGDEGGPGPSRLQSCPEENSLFSSSLALDDDEEDDDDEMTSSPFAALEAELERYLRKRPVRGDRTMRSLDAVSDLGTGVLQEMYIRYNTRMSGAANSERLFSLCGHVFTKTRTRLGKFLGVLVFMQVNWDLLLFLKLRKKDKAEAAAKSNKGKNAKT